MAATLTLTVMARLNLEGIIRQQRSPDDETLMLNYELLKKIRIPQEERQAYLRETITPNGTAVEFFNKTIRASAPSDLEFESAEIRRLDTLLKDWKQYSTDDVEWLQPLKQQLASINNGIATPKKKTKEATN